MPNMLYIIGVVLLTGCASIPDYRPERVAEINFNVDWDCINQFDEPLPFLHPQCSWNRDDP